VADWWERELIEMATYAMKQGCDEQDHTESSEG